MESLKVTYFDGKKVCVYINVPSSNLDGVKGQIEYCLFEEHKLPCSEYRLYWIDDDLDEIDIVTQNDYDAFNSKSKDFKQKHVHVDSVNKDTEKPAVTTNLADNETKIPPAAGSYNSARHHFIECDSCHMLPIVGFRYKCVQCDNYDLCENCESKHFHPKHMMVRMPNYTSGIKLDIDNVKNVAACKNTEQAKESASITKERHHGRRHLGRRHRRSNVFSQFYEIMNDFAEGGVNPTTSHAKKESPTSLKSTNAAESDKQKTIAYTKAAASAACLAAEHAQEASKIAAKTVHESVSKDDDKNTENIITSTSIPLTSEKPNSANKEKEDVTTSAGATAPQPTAVPVIPVPTLEFVSQFLDPQLLRSGVEILNNFNDMFAKMLDPMENFKNDTNPIYPDLRKNSTTPSTKSSVSSNLNSMESDKKSSEEKNMEVDPEHIEEKQKTGSEMGSIVQIDDLGSDSENESSSESEMESESFVKLDAPKQANASTTSSADNTPNQSLKSNSSVPDFVQLSADLKSHIAQEAANGSKNVEKNNAKSTVGGEKEPLSNISSASNATNNEDTCMEKRAVIVYHPDKRINSSVHAMMAMGFSNEGDWLTQLLESVNGNISEALDVMSAAQRSRNA